MATKKSSKPSKKAVKSGTLSTEDRKEMASGTYAFPGKRKEPLNNASHVRNAIARFDQVKDVTDAERDEAFQHIKTAAKKFGVEVTETSWKELGKAPAKKSAKKAAKKASKKTAK